MSYILYDGTMYMRFKDAESRRILKSPELAQAHCFSSRAEAAKVLRHATRKLRAFKVYMVGKDGALIGQPAPGRRVSRKAKLRRRIYDLYNGRCAICGASLPFENMTIDHIIPLAKGGANDSSNLQCACRYCNSIKKDMDAGDFLQKISDIYTFQYTKHMKDGWKKKGVLMLLDRLERQGTRQQG